MSADINDPINRSIVYAREMVRLTVRIRLVKCYLLMFHRFYRQLITIVNDIGERYRAHDY